MQLNWSNYVRFESHCDENMCPVAEKVKVTIKVPERQNYGTAMRGFFPQMRDANTNEAVGKWDNNEISWAKGVDCNDEEGFDALTHANSGMQFPYF